MSQDATTPAPGEGPYLLTPSPCQHQQQSHRLIAAAAQEAKPDRALVLGAGSCFDIPLAALAARFAQLTVNDSDATRLAEGLEAAGIDGSQRATVDVRVADLTGCTQRILGHFDSIFAACEHPRLAGEQTAEFLEAETPPGMSFDGQYDLVIASCVLGQLHVGVARGAHEAFARRFSGQPNELAANERWQRALFQWARRVEARFIDDLAARLAPGGLIYLSETPQMCHVKLTPESQWLVEGTYRMLRTRDLSDYLDERFAIIAHGRWHWLVSPPEEAGQVGQLFDVQAVVLRMWRS